MIMQKFALEFIFERIDFGDLARDFFRQPEAAVRSAGEPEAPASPYASLRHDIFIIFAQNAFMHFPIEMLISVCECAGSVQDLQAGQ